MATTTTTENASSSNRTEIITLILADMRNRRLIMGLQLAGLHSDDFYMNLTDMILQKAGFKKYADEEVCNWYEDTIYKLIDNDMRYFVAHQRELASRMYELLLCKRQTVQEVRIVSFSLSQWVRRVFAG